jgi:hypothetical protein
MEQPAACHLGSQCMNRRTPGPIHNCDSGEPTLAAGCPRHTPHIVRLLIRLAFFGPLILRNKFRRNQYPTASIASGVGAPAPEAQEPCTRYGCQYFRFHVFYDIQVYFAICSDTFSRMEC